MHATAWSFPWVTGHIWRRRTEKNTVVSKWIFVRVVPLIGVFTAAAKDR